MIKMILNIIIDIRLIIVYLLVLMVKMELGLRRWRWEHGAYRLSMSRSMQLSKR
jgi:hypothetical protein